MCLKKKIFLRKKVGHGPRCPSPMDHLVILPETILMHVHQDYTNAESFRATACLEDSEKSISRFCSKKWGTCPQPPPLVSWALF